MDGGIKQDREAATKAGLIQLLLWATAAPPSLGRPGRLVLLPQNHPATEARKTWSATGPLVNGSGRLGWGVLILCFLACPISRKAGFMVGENPQAETWRFWHLEMRLTDWGTERAGDVSRHLGAA